MKNHIFILFVLVSSSLFAQDYTQTVRGKIIDKQTQTELVGVNIIILNTDPIIGATTDLDGNFRMENVKVGRHSFQISMLGYNTITLSDIIVSSGKESMLNIEMEESVNMLGAVEITGSKKRETNNRMAMLSARTFSVEETQRYADGNDDPSRMVTSYAGVVATGLTNNGIVVRGNAPKGLLWRLEGVEISSPNHFANMVTFGGGGLSAISSQVLSNSDFFTSAFPAEYGNALSGVFDLKMRTGNNEKREHTFSIGSNGIDIASEGPFKKGKKSTYLFNYRYSTLALLTPILPDEAGIIKFQDLSFKLNFPTKKYGTFTLWGLGALDNQLHKAEFDSTQWVNKIDKLESQFSLGLGALGLSNKLILGEKTYLHSIISATGNLTDFKEKEVNDGTLFDKHFILNNSLNLTYTSILNHKFSAKHFNRTGVILTKSFYNVDISKTDVLGDPLLQFAEENGASNLLKFHTQSKYKLTENFILNAGLYSQFFTLNNNYTIEPRIGLKYRLNSLQTIGIAYGSHSQLEMISYYLAKQGNLQPNKDLDFSKAHHVVFSYERALSEYTRIIIEPYYQYLYDIPVIENSYFSLQNLEANWFINDNLVNNGTGKNIGIDLTIEQFLRNGFYYLLTSSLFDSKYTGGDGIERNTRFNKNYIINILGGKEWKVGKNDNNILSINAKVSISGGDKIHPIDEDLSYQFQDIIFDYSRAFENKKSDAYILSYSVNYRRNKEKHSSFWSFHMINALMQKEFVGYNFDKQTQEIVKEEAPYFIPSISYKIEF